MERKGQGKGKEDKGNSNMQLVQWLNVSVM